MSKLVAKHGNDHRINGPDPLEAYGAIQFDVINEGDWLFSQTTSSHFDGVSFGTMFVVDNNHDWYIPVVGSESAPFGFHNAAFSDHAIVYRPNFGLANGFWLYGAAASFGGGNAFHLTNQVAPGYPVLEIDIVQGDFLLSGPSWAIGGGVSDYLMSNGLEIELHPAFSTAAGPELSANSARDMYLDVAGNGTTALWEVHHFTDGVLMRVISSGGGFPTYHIKTGASWTADL